MKTKDERKRLKTTTKKQNEKVTKKIIVKEFRFVPVNM